MSRAGPQVLGRGPQVARQAEHRTVAGSRAASRFDGQPGGRRCEVGSVRRRGQRVRAHEFDRVREQPLGVGPGRGRGRGPGRRDDTAVDLAVVTLPGHRAAAAASGVSASIKASEDATAPKTPPGIVTISTAAS